MLFRTFEPYNNGFDYLTHSKSICFICYETAIAYECEPIQLNSQIDYMKKCNCNSWIHKNCLNAWYNKSRTCPICRNSLNKRENLSMIVLENGTNYYILINRYFFRNITKISRTFAIVIFIYYIYKVYLFLLSYNYTTTNYTNTNSDN
jgi:hypothetical protein